MLRTEAPPFRPAGADRPRSTLRGASLHAALAAGVFVLALALLGWEAGRADFEGDEADYTATSRYFGYLFLQRDPWRPEWDSNHWTRTQPPLTRYVVGGWLTARGYDLEAMNRPYVSTASSVEANRRRGRVPTDDVLAAARQPMVLLGAGAVALLYGLGALLGGPTGGVISAGLALSGGFLRSTLVHAWAEAPLAFFLLLSALLVAVCARILARDGRWAGWASAAGLALGLACTTKLTGYVGLAATLGLAVAAALFARHRRRASTDTPEAAVPGTPRAWLGAGGVIVTLALAVTVALNPFLWRGPVQGLAEMAVQRRDEMTEQQKQWPEFAVLDWRARPSLMAVGSTRFGPWDELPALAVPLNLALVSLGGIALAITARRGASLPGGWPAAIVFLSWVVAHVAAIVGGLGLSYPRYFLPALLLLLPLAGVGGAWLIEFGRATLGRRRA